MPFGRSLLKLVFIFVLVMSLSACGGSEEGPLDRSDTGQRVDAGSSKMDSGTVGDAGVDKHVDTGPCEPEELARRKVAVNDTVNDGAVTVMEESGIASASIDAASGGVAMASEESFVYLDLDAGAKLQLTDVQAYENEEWDIGFRRTKIRLNGADSGPGAWQAASTGSDWEGATNPPGADAEWFRDDFVDEHCEVTTGPRGKVEFGFAQWYDYDSLSHGVSVPDQAVWALRDTRRDRVVKFEIESYTDATYEVRWTEF